MPRRLLVAAAAAALAVGLAVPVSASAQDIRVTLNVLTWNIQGSKMGDGRLAGVVDHIKRSGAEYVGLQEVSADDAETIARGLGWGTDPTHLSTAFEHGGFAGFGYDEGIAMLSRYSMTSDNAGIDPQGRGRKLQHAVITKNGAVFHAYNTHLGSDDWDSDQSAAVNQDNRNRQATWVRDRILDRERTATDRPVTYFLGGDMNSHPVPDEPNSAAYHTLSDAFADSWSVKHPGANSHPGCDDDSGCTITIRHDDKSPQAPTLRIDYVFVVDQEMVRSVATPPPWSAAEFAPLSDHLPYQALLG